MFLSKPIKLDELASLLNECAKRLGLVRTFARGTRIPASSAGQKRVKTKPEELIHPMIPPSLLEPVEEDQPLEQPPQQQEAEKAVQYETNDIEDRFFTWLCALCSAGGGMIMGYFLSHIL